MKRSMLLIMLAVCVAGVIAMVVGSRVVSAQNGTSAQNGSSDPDEKPPFYNPYPPGILPGDLGKEIDRVRREVRDLEAKALATSKTLPNPLVIAGNPPTIQGAGYQAVEDLGELLNFDENFSPFRNEACGFCHMPYAGFSGPIPSVNLTMIAYPGTFHFRAGKRTAQRYTYSPMFPVLEFNIQLDSFFGGNFWDARATGYKLQSPDAEQAQHPPVDTQEMGFPDTACIAFRLQQAAYRSLFTQVWGDSLDIVFPPETEEICETPGGAAEFGTNVTPIKLSPDDRTKANNVFDHWAQSVSFFEASPDVSAFSSKFDAFLDGNATLTADEMAGLKLFDGKGNCNSCHLDGRGTTLTPNLTDTSAPAASEPLFTCFGYANLGLPLNPRDAIFYQNKPDFFGFTPNPDGFAFRDLGVGTFLRSGPGSAPNPNFQWNQLAPLHDGQMQTSTARDVAMVPPQCKDAQGNPTTEAPGPYFQKEFFHNGYAKSLKQLVHFYNTRDVFPFKVTSGHCKDVGKTEKVDCWPMPEVPNNIDMTVGKLGLTDQEENLIVIFLRTLTDGFNPANPTGPSTYPDINTFTGTCMSGGNASTQGNEFLIPTPLLPPCASDVCGVAPTPGPSPIP